MDICFENGGRWWCGGLALYWEIYKAGKTFLTKRDDIVKMAMNLVAIIQGLTIYQ